MKSNKQNSKIAEFKLFGNLTNRDLFFIAAIFIIWLVSYVFWELVIFQENLAWDEVSYLSVAKGIARDFDFSSRSYTVMGLLKQGYPTTLINFPVFSAYIAVFFKLFGVSLRVGYFSTWFAALGVCVFLYLIFCILSKNNRLLAFITSIAYLYNPGTIKNCNTAMMEQAGCFLLCICVFLILKDYAKGKFDYLTILKFSLSFLSLWLFKSIFIGFFFGAFVFILLSYSSKITGKKIDTKIPLPVFLLASYGLFVVLYYIFMKFVFLPVSPMMNFSPAQESAQVYADFLGGFLNNFFVNIKTNINFFLHVVLKSYLFYPTNLDQHNPLYESYTRSILKTNAYYIYVWVFFFVFFNMIALTFATWKRFSPIQKVFIFLTLGMMISFNLIFNFLFMTYHINIWRYNAYSLPLYLCYFSILIEANFEYIKPFITEHRKVSIALVSIFFICGYLPLFLSCTRNHIQFERNFQIRARNNAHLIRSVISQDPDTKFVYMNDGTHTVFDDYPVRWVFKDATNKQLMQVNKILPYPIDYLFLRSSDWLFENNKEAITKGLPIVNDQYVYYGLNQETGLVVYKYYKKAQQKKTA